MIEISLIWREGEVREKSIIHYLLLVLKSLEVGWKEGLYHYKISKSNFLVRQLEN